LLAASQRTVGPSLLSLSQVLYYGNNNPPPAHLQSLARPSPQATIVAPSHGDR